MKPKLCSWCYVIIKCRSQRPLKKINYFEVNANANNLTVFFILH